MSTSGASGLCLLNGPVAAGRGGAGGVHEPGAPGARPPRVPDARGGRRATRAADLGRCAASSSSVSPLGEAPVLHAWDGRVARDRAGTGSAAGVLLARHGGSAATPRADVEAAPPGGDRAHGGSAGRLPPLARAGGGTVVRVHAPRGRAHGEREPDAGDGRGPGGIPLRARATLPDRLECARDARGRQSRSSRSRRLMREGERG